VRARLALPLALVVPLIVAGAGASSAVQSRPYRVAIDCPSPALGGALPAAVYLPSGYVGATTRYPVVYFLHGLPAEPTSYEATAFVARAAAATGVGTIVVTPQGARTQEADEEYLDLGRNKDWTTAISRDLPRCIDFRFRTIAHRYGRALIGVSAGGFGALNIGLRNLATFAAIESWSGYSAATDPSGLQVLELGSKKANRRARVRRGRHLSQALIRKPAFVGFYVGRQDKRFRNTNVQLDQAFDTNHVRHLFRIYEGGHEQSLWTNQAPRWIGLALLELAAARG
jgi:enterochelin esterase-like enzyme